MSLKLLVIVYVVILLLVIRQAMARPGGEWSSSAYGCNNADSKKIEICQRCAKQTKSPIVYPMCCNEEDEVHFWCYRYTTYGKVA
ncbi:hypothetical protein NQ315_006191 [Exocentrus adspersus]|uniref:Uncharacterized protein n=1 Tax=Exocentrus adspersus TaxID=1586481 RepID=A0AAV8VZ83_9CUCU|nr:hypothetical protein NQ315_006191 [Exocentrus adspersus]